MTAFATGLMVPTETLQKKAFPVICIILSIFSTIAVYCFLIQNSAISLQGCTEIIIHLVASTDVTEVGDISHIHA